MGRRACFNICLGEGWTEGRGGCIGSRLQSFGSPERCLTPWLPFFMFLRLNIHISGLTTSVECSQYQDSSVHSLILIYAVPILDRGLLLNTI